MFSFYRFVSLPRTGSISCSAPVLVCLSHSWYYQRFDLIRQLLYPLYDFAWLIHHFAYLFFHFQAGQGLQIEIGLFCFFEDFRPLKALR